MTEYTVSERNSLPVGLIKLLRPKQWVKNLFVMAPLLFSGQFMNVDSILHSVIAMLIFCAASSAVYVLNDINDVEKDRAHPKKRMKRPIASGAVSTTQAWCFLAVLYIFLALSLNAYRDIAVVVIGYIALNIAYSYKLKHIPVVDIFCIAIGFVLRTMAGAMALGVSLSQWMFITTLCLALYLASIKRRQELLKSGKESRNVLGKYSVQLVSRYSEMSATGALVFYSLYVISEKPDMTITIPLVLFGLFRYWYNVDSLDGGESPTDSLLSDYPLIFTIIAWVGTCVYVLMP
ncbi:decaprenyl-phosphate phosphoribosyltransferase [Enterobacter sp. ENT02]|uniref:decaprenyl-phosphate phosphoribosyltransferase n=1 Tax=Enterobacter sp. ENT02 TaxID=2854767 RepID=UPI001C453C65|nr:decaprenyl-phosphate phosphoribosyltransferase [Enterobacter sp. ENT02]MBV7560557.1 decaprenyl-phosphate phosphoribosyltransferase [Enterobacter sp. ENT02]